MKKFLSSLLFVFATMCALPAFAAKLPTDYTGLEWIQGTGTQWIDTGISNTNGWKVDISFAFVDTEEFLVGANAGTGEGFLSFRPGTSDLYGRNNGKVFNEHVNYTGVSVHNAVAEMFTDSTKVEIDGKTIVNRSASGTRTNLNVKILSIYGNNIKSGQVYNAKFYDQNNNLVRNMIPAKRNSDSAIGMYDTVNNRFYENAGTGTFTAGPIACDGVVRNYESAVGTVAQNGTPSPTNPIEPVFYTQGDMVLRRIGDYADSYDATTGKITRRIGVKVLNGSEAWSQFPNSGRFYLENSFQDIDGSVRTDASCSHFPVTVDALYGVLGFSFYKNHNPDPMQLRMTYPSVTSVPAFKTWLAEQYATGTPVTIYYPLATPVEETPASTTYCAPAIKIATTAYNNNAFSSVQTALNSAVDTIKTVVANTILQTTAVQQIASNKQNRPNSACPAGKTCLLVEDMNGEPHWYEIIEEYIPPETEPTPAEPEPVTP